MIFKLYDFLLYFSALHTSYTHIQSLPFVVVTKSTAFHHML